MKKRIWMIAVVAVIAAVALTAAGCQSKFTQDDLFAIASFAQGETGERGVVIEIKNGDTVVASYDGEKWECVSDKIAFDKVTFVGSGSGLNFNANAFKDSSFEVADDVATFKAAIGDTEAFLADAAATDATVEVQVDVAQKKLIVTKIGYTTVKSGVTFAVSVTVNA